MTPDILKQFESLHYRRTLLEALAQLSCQLHGASEGLAAVQQIVRPSQQFSLALRERLTREIAFYSAQTEAGLRENLQMLNTGLEKACTLFLRIAQLNDHAFIQNFQANNEQREKFRLLQQKLNRFQQQAQHYLAIRIVLQDTGYQLDSVRFSLPQGALNQELLAQELDELRTREKLHKKRFRTEVSSMLSDTQLLMSVAQNNAEVLALLSCNAQHLSSVLQVLDAGGNIQLIPEVIEAIQCDLLPDVVFEKNTSALQPNPQDQPVESLCASADRVTQSHKANNVFIRIKIWVSTSWNVTWAETKYYRR